MPASKLPHRESGYQCYIMIGDQIKYEPSWQNPSRKQLLKEAGINDCLSSAMAGLRHSSLNKVNKTKREQYHLNKMRACSGALQVEDVGLSMRSGKVRSVSRGNFHSRNVFQ